MALTNAPDIYQAQDFLSKFVGLTAYENKQDLIYLLRKNGVTVDEKASPNDVILMTYLAIAQSPQFKNDIQAYMKAAYQEEAKMGIDANKDGFDDETGQPLTAKAKKQAKIAAQGGTKVGNLIRSVATEENIGALLNTGLSFVSQKMTAKADQKSINAAAQLQAQKAQAELAQAAKFDAQAKKNKWIVPVAIGAFVVIGIVAYMIIKKKNK